MNVSLKDYGVGSVFAIDDYFDNYVNKDTILNNELIDSIEKDVFEPLDRYRDILLEQEVDPYEGKKISDIDIEADIVEEINQKISESMPFLYTHLKREYGEKFNCKGVRTDDHATHIQRTIKEIEEEMESQKAEGKYVLVVMDKKLQNTDKTDRLLYRYLNAIAKLLKEKSNILLVLYSSNPDQFKDYNSVTQHLEEKMTGLPNEIDPNILAMHLNYISKGDLNQTELTELLVRYVLKSQKSAFLNIYKESFDEADFSLRNKLWNSDKDQNRALFYYDYLSEGQHVDDIIFDLFINKFRSVVNEKIIQNHTMLINPLRKSMQRFTASYSDDDRMLFLRFQKELLLKLSRQVFEPISSSDITFGDIIEVCVEGSKKYYMVVGQECDLTVRHDSNRKLDYVQLVEMELHEDYVNSKMLMTEIKKFIGSNANRNRNRKSIYQMFIDFDPNFDDPKSDVSLFFKSLGFNNNTIDKMLKEIKFKGEEDYDFSLGSLGIQNERNNLYKDLSYYEIKEKKERLSIDSIWLDALTLCEENGSIVLSDRTIGKSHEIRRPLRRHIQKKYQDLQADLIMWVSGSQYNELTNEQKETMIDKALEFHLGKSKIKVTSKLENNILELKIENAKRIGRIEYLEARNYHHSLIEYQTRIGGSSTPRI